MTRALLITILVCAALAVAPLRLLAQESTPQPTPADWMVYEDPAMHFRAPAGWQPVGQRQIDAQKLTDDPVVVAAWVYPDRDHPRKLVINQEFFEGDYKAFEAQLEQQLRGQFTDPFFKNKQDVKLRNGMPAEFMEMSTGSGFNVAKFYILLWSDGQRGISILLSAQLNDLSGDAAQRLMSDATAVRYPTGRD
ncbi:MAG TPA: hypothetical protein VK702_12020 [Candidatus Acidoferrum sp.]|nr:hypothetical protein [Candidatus Acidoferrum sp.]